MFVEFVGGVLFRRLFCGSRGIEDTPFVVWNLFSQFLHEWEDEAAEAGIEARHLFQGQPQTAPSRVKIAIEKFSNPAIAVWLALLVGLSLVLWYTG